MRSETCAHSASRVSVRAPAIHDLPIPRRHDAFLIRVTYAGVNPLDSRLLERLTANSTYPFVMGIDFAGVVDHVPAGESDLRAGERIFGMAHTHGSYAEYTAIATGMRAEPVARIPDGVSDEHAAALPTSGLTALRSLDLLGVGADQRLVVMGATGGVGGYAVQMALSRGANVIATVRGDVQEARRPRRRGCLRHQHHGRYRCPAEVLSRRCRRGPRSRQRPRRDTARRRDSQAGELPRLDDLRGRRSVVCQAQHRSAQPRLEQQSLAVATRTARSCAHAR